MKFSNGIKDILRRLICWIVFLQLLNLSIDPPNLSLNPRLHPFSAEYGLQNIYEWMATELFGQTCPEDEGDTEMPPETVELYCFTCSAPRLGLFDIPVEHETVHLQRYPVCFLEPHYPPPKHC